MNDDDVLDKSFVLLFGWMCVADGTLVQVCHRSTVATDSCVKEVESKLYSISVWKWNVGGVPSGSVWDDPDELKTALIFWIRNLSLSWSCTKGKLAVKFEG